MRLNLWTSENLRHLPPIVRGRLAFGNLFGVKFATSSHRCCVVLCSPFAMFYFPHFEQQRRAAKAKAKAKAKTKEEKLKRGKFHATFMIADHSRAANLLFVTAKGTPAHNDEQFNKL